MSLQPACPCRSTPLKLAAALLEVHFLPRALSLDRLSMPPRSRSCSAIAERHAMRSSARNCGMQKKSPL